MANNDATLGNALDRLSKTIDLRAAASADTSYTAKLLAAGVGKCAKKLGEEAVELALAAVSETPDSVVNEAADVLYHLSVLLKAAGVSPDAVGAELLRREGVSGLEEKASRLD